MRNLACLSALPILFSCLGGSAALADPPQVFDLLPESTVFVVSVADCSRLKTQLRDTTLGRLSLDPQIRPIMTAIDLALGDLLSGAKETIGLGWTDLWELFQGQLTAAVVVTEQQPPALVALLDTRNQIASARIALDRAGKLLEASGGKRTEEQVQGMTVTVFSGVGARKRDLVFAVDGSTVIVATELAPMALVLERWHKPAGGGLLSNEKFSAIVKRCSVADKLPGVFVYFDPIATVRCMGVNDPTTQLATAMLPVLGLDGLEALGATLSFDASPYDWLLHAHALLSGTRMGVLEAVAPLAVETVPEPWVPSDASDYTTLRWDAAQTYRAIGRVFDGFRGQGAFAEWVRQRLNQSTGLDFESEILPLLDGRLTSTGRIDASGSVARPTRLVGLRITDPIRAGAAIEKFVAAKGQSFKQLSADGRTFYRIEPPPRPDGKPADPNRPSSCFGLLGDYLVISDRPEGFEHAVSSMAKTGEKLGDAIDFKLVVSRALRLAGEKKPMVLRFERPEETARWFHSTFSDPDFRKRIHDRAERDRGAKMLDSVLQSTVLPPLSAIQAYLAPSGAVLFDDESGLHYVAFGLKRNN